MEYIVGKNTTSYSLGKKGKYRFLTERVKTFLQSGRSFNGRLVFVRLSEGTKFIFQPMIKVVGMKGGVGSVGGGLGTGVYYYPNQVTEVRGRRDAFAIPRAGEIGGVRNNPFGLAAGEVEGDLNTAPSVGEMMSGERGSISDVKCPKECKQIDRYGTCDCPKASFSGIHGESMVWGVQAGQMMGNPLNGKNPYQVMGGEIEGLHEPVSHEYHSNASGNGKPMGINAGQSFDWATLSQGVNPFGLSAGEVEGDRLTAPESYNPESFINANGWDEYDVPYSERNPNMWHYGRARTNVTPQGVDYSESYPQYMDANFSGFDGGLQAGEIFNYGTQGEPMNPFGLEAGVSEGAFFKAPESYNPESFSSADAKDELTEEEMEALHKDSDKKGGKLWDWLKSDDAKKLAGDTVGIAKGIWNEKQKEKLNNEGGGTTQPVVMPSNGGTPEQKKTILGMHPLTFGIGAGVVVLMAIGITFAIRSGKK